MRYLRCSPQGCRALHGEVRVAPRRRLACVNQTHAGPRPDFGGPHTGISKTVSMFSRQILVQAGDHLCAGGVEITPQHDLHEYYECRTAVYHGTPDKLCTLHV